MVHKATRSKSKPATDRQGVPEGEQVKAPRTRGQTHRGDPDDPDPPADDYTNPLLEY